MQFLWLWIFVSGGLGAITRHLLSESMGSISGTLLVNGLGCLAFGFLYALFEHHYVASEYRTIVLAGFLGGFTTMSAFAGHVLLFFNQQRVCDGIVYLLGTNAIALSAVWIGFISAYAILK